MKYLFYDWDSVLNRCKSKSSTNSVISADINTGIFVLISYK